MQKVSIVVPAYNADEWWLECLHSIRSQSYEDVELIIIHDEGSGAAAARNRGLDQATGEYVAFVDADDYLEPDAIKRMVDAMENVDMVCGSFRKFGLFDMTVSHPTAVLDKWEVAMYAMNNLKQPGAHQMLSGCWAKLFRRKLVNQFPKLTTAEDMAFNFDYLTRCTKVRFLSDVVYHNRKREGSVTTVFDPKDKWGLFGFMEALKYVKRFLLPYYSEAEIDVALDNSKLYHSALYFMRICESEKLSPRETFRKLYP